MANATTRRVVVERKEMYPLSETSWRMDKRTKIYHIGIKVIVDRFPWDIDMVAQCGLVIPEGKTGNWEKDCTPHCQECEALAIMLELSE